MSVYLTELTRFLAAQSWQIAVLTIAVALATAALRHRTAHIRYLLWLIVLAKCLVPPVFVVSVRVLPAEAPAAVPIASSEPAQHERGDAMKPAPAPASAREPSSAFVVAASEQGEHRVREPLPFNAYAAIAWIVGASLYFVQSGLRAIRGHHWVRRGRRPLPDDARQDTEAILPVSPSGRSPAIWIMDDIGQPFVLGLLRGSIYVPTTFLENHDIAQRRHVLAHELAHIQRLDPAMNLLQTIAQGLFWCHPLVWWVNRQIRHEREKCCDERAVAQLGAKAKDYCSAVVETLASAESSEQPIPSLAVADSSRNLEERIRTMLEPGRTFHERSSYTGGICVVLVVLLTAPTTLVLSARARTEPAMEQPPRTTDSQKEAISHGDLKGALPDDWRLKYDDGITGGGNARRWPAGMADDLVSLEVTPIPRDREKDDWRAGKYEFEIRSSDDREVGTIMVQPNLMDEDTGQMLLPNRMTLRPGLYSLLYRREGGRNPDNFWMYGGPFEVDLSKPGMYDLRFAPKLGQARITGALGGCYALNFARMDATGTALRGTVYQYPPKQHVIDGIPAGRYRLSAVAQLDRSNVFVSQAAATVAADQTITVDMPAPPTGTCSLKGKLLGRPRKYKTPWPTHPESSGKWYILLRNPGSGPIRQTHAYEAKTMDSRYVIRGSAIVQETDDTARYDIVGIAPGEYTVTAIEHPSFGGCTVERQQSRTLTLKAGEETILDFDLRGSTTP